MFKNLQALVLICASCFAFTSAQTETTTSAFENKTFFWTQRYLGGLKVKVDKNFTATSWGAIYFGDGAQYKTESDPYNYSGWDAVPGFNYELGEIFNGIKASTGGDLYLTHRVQEKGHVEMEEVRPRWNFALTKPFSFGGSVQWISRFERQMLSKYKINPQCDTNNLNCVTVRKFAQGTSYSRYRSTLKISGPSFLNWKLTPYAYSESFNLKSGSGGWYFSETEFGINFSPFNGVNMSFADNLQALFREDEIIKNHMLCLYAFYTIDLSDFAFFKNNN